MNKFYLTLGIFCLFSATTFAQSENSVEVEKSTKSESKTNVKVTPQVPSSTQVPEQLKQVNFAATPSGVSSSTLPVDFPQFIDTGNPEADAADYKARKIQWIADNPEKYEALTAGSTKGTSIVPSTPLVPTKVTK